MKKDKYNLVVFITIGFLISILTGQLEETTQAAFDSARYAVELSLGLIGIYFGLA